MVFGTGGVRRSHVGGLGNSISGVRGTAYPISEAPHGRFFLASEAKT
jgi:hypothetical protein